MIEHRLKHGGHAGKAGTAVTLDRRQHLRRLEARTIAIAAPVTQA